MVIWSYIGIFIVILIFYRFLTGLGKRLPVLELMLLIAGLQWIVGPLIEYNNPSDHYKYYMYVDQADYMGFVVPAFAVFSLIIIYTVKSTSEVNLDRLQHYSKYGFKLLLIGVFFDLFGGFLPGALGFLAFILSNFKFVGAIILFYSEDKRLKSLFYGAIVYLLLTSILKALFHDFLLWTVFFYMFWALKNKPNITKIIATFLIGGLLAITLQTVKSAFRNQIWDNYAGNKVELFFSLMVDSFMVDETEVADLDDGVDSNVRLNQGWIISAVLNNIPRNDDYLNGATIKEAVFASILPRFLNPDKAQAGGQENFRKFTGLEISQGTSMGISILGEAYGNFAHVGGIIFMGIWGFFLSKIWLFLKAKIKDNILLVAFIPLIFLQVIKAETELVVVLNHLIKSMIVVLLFLWFAKKYWNWEFNR